MHLLPVQLFLTINRSISVCCSMDEVGLLNYFCQCGLKLLFKAIIALCADDRNFIKMPKKRNEKKPTCSISIAALDFKSMKANRS